MELKSINIHSTSGDKFIISLDVNKDDTILDVKKALFKAKRKYKVARQEIRLQQKAKGVKESETLGNLNLKTGDKLYVKDLGVQIGWATVFYLEYAGPLFLYLWTFQRPWIFYGEDDDDDYTEMTDCAKIAAACWSFHYAKRILETKFVHRFSHSTMPLFNLFKNCFYYWGFALYVAYHVNHPLFTAPSDLQVYISLGVFVLCELGNLSIHLALRNLRPAGSNERHIPKPTKNPFTLLFYLVSCPNYTYEAGAWISFAVMTQCLPAGFFAFCGFYQMAAWALGKQKNYKTEFSNYPKIRKAIIPFIL